MGKSPNRYKCGYCGAITDKPGMCKNCDMGVVSPFYDETVEQSSKSNTGVGAFVLIILVILCVFFAKNVMNERTNKQINNVQNEYSVQETIENPVSNNDYNLGNINIERHKHIEEYNTYISVYSTVNKRWEQIIIKNINDRDYKTGEVNCDEWTKEIYDGCKDIKSQDVLDLRDLMIEAVGKIKSAMVLYQQNLIEEGNSYIQDANNIISVEHYEKAIELGNKIMNE